MRVHQQSAFVLLNRPYSETSWIVEVFSKDYGRLVLIAKGARRIKSRLKGVLMPFQPLLLSWSGKGEIPTLISAEIDQEAINIAEHELRGDALVCGFYCNELVVNLLHRNDPHARLFEYYQSTISALNRCEKNDVLANVLRDFEKIAIKETGYGVNFDVQADGKTGINDTLYYRFQPGSGFVRCEPHERNAFIGRVIRSMTGSDHNTTVQQALSNHEMSQGKHLMRDILNQTLGHKKINSRELFFPRGRT